MIRPARYILTVLFVLTTATIVSAQTTSVTLNWDPNPEPDISGYKLYYVTGTVGEPYDGTGALQGDSPIIIPIAQLNDPNHPEYILTQLDNQAVYYFVLTAYNNDDPSNESGYSNWVSNANNHQIQCSIKINDNDGPVTIPQGYSAPVTVTLDPGSHDGDNADWWVVADTSFGWYHYDLASDSWRPGQTVTYQAPLFNFASPLEVLNTSELPIGAYTIYFGVDMDMNGSLDMDQIYYDSVDVNVE